MTDVDDEVKTPEVRENQTEDTNDVMPLSPDFSNLTTEVRNNPSIRCPPPIESPPITPKSPPRVVGYNPRKTAKYNPRPNPRPNADPDFRRLDALTTTH